MSETHRMYPELSTNLRELAKDYFNGEDIDYHSGICSALADYTLSKSDAYHAMGDLMAELGFHEAYFSGCSDFRDKWEPRAYMCLFLAEYLEASV